MQSVVGVVFKENDKKYYFDPNNLNLHNNQTVIVETERGFQYGTVVSENVKIKDENLILPLKRVIRITTRQDFLNHQTNLSDAKKAIIECNKLINEYHLDMHIIDAAFTFDRKQLLFKFIADERIDFRQLARQLATIYKTRIELRQIGVRDKAKEVGGYGPCGLQLCCSSFLYDINSVSINMAKNQNISLNPTKINGVCGRLLCCLKYEDDTYEQYRKQLPDIGQRVKTPNGEGRVVSLDILNQTYKVDVLEHGMVEVDIKDTNDC